MRKVEALRGLAEKRRASRWPGYLGIGDFHGGVYECDHVSPYTKGANNLDAELFLLLLLDCSFSASRADEKRCQNASFTRPQPGNRCTHLRVQPPSPHWMPDEL
jgi:hypothetical protein